MNTILFAAGASYGFFEPNLSTSYLTNKVRDKSEWVKVIKKYKSYVESNIVVADENVVMKIISIILHYFPKANFEQIAEVLDKISSCSMDFMPNHNILNLFEHTLLDILIGNSNKWLGVGLQQIPFLYRQLIAENILDLEQNHQSTSYSSLAQKQRNFIKYVKLKGDGISIISTNYDDCVLSSIDDLGIDVGVRVVDNLHGNQVDIHDFMTAHNVIYFPHGHLRFQMTDKLQITVWNDILEANEQRWKGLSNGHTSTNYVFLDPFAYNFNTFLTTGQTKDNAFNNLPYSIYYQRMAIDFERSRNIIIVGYSFCDEHFNRLLHAYLQIDSLHHVYIIDYYSDIITMTLEGQSEYNLLRKIQKVFQQPWFLKKDVVSGKLLPFYEEEVFKLNNIGYGKIFPQVTFYKKGYAAFLEEYLDVLEENSL